MCPPDIVWLIPVLACSVTFNILLFYVVNIFVYSEKDWRMQCIERKLLEYRQTDGKLVWKDNGELTPT